MIPPAPHPSDPVHSAPRARTTGRHGPWFRVAYRLVDGLSRRGIDDFVGRRLAEQPGRVLNVGCGERSPCDPRLHREVRIDLVVGPGVDLVADAHHLPFRDAAFDAVASTEVLEHLARPETACDEISRVLRRDGLALVTTRFLFPIHEAPHDYYRFTRHALERLFAAFRRVEVLPQHSGFQTLLVLAGRQIMEPGRGYRVLALPLAVAVRLAALLDPLVRRLLPGTTMTTGYLLAAWR